MKHTYIIVILVAWSFGARAQFEKRFQLAGGGGFNTSTDFTPRGYLFYVEPSYRINEKVAIGFRTESLSRHDSYVSVMGTYSAFAKYYFSREEPRFFAGIGWGFYTPNRALLIPSPNNDDYIPVSGYHPRIGWEADHFELILEYNIVPEVDMVYTNTSGLPVIEKMNTSYFAVKFGLRIGI
jgi:hypothetical protein